MLPDPASPEGGGEAPCTCQALREAARRMTALYDAAMAPYGLRISQYALLSRLRRRGPIPVHALAADLGVDRTTLGRNLLPLERDGLVRSEPDPADRRVRRLALTPKGAAAQDAATPAWQSVQAGFQASYGASETQALHDQLRRIAALGPA